MINPLEKPKRVVDPAYLNFIRSMDCYVSQRSEPDPHHMVTVKTGGSDYFALPLAHLLHNELGTIGLSEFEKKHNVNLWRGVAIHEEIYICRLVKHIQGLGAVLPIVGEIGR